MWNSLREVCLSINGTQFVRFEKGTNEFKNYFKQIPVPFKLYADFEPNLESVKTYESSYSKRYQCHIPCSSPYRLVCVGQLLFLEVKMLLLNLLRQF